MATDAQCINTIRALAADVVQGANSGHPGAPMGCAPMAHVLYSQLMKFSASDIAWPNRDRFVLSNGHGCALQYVMLHLCGYDLSMDDLKNFRQLDSKTPGHPESHMTGGIEVSTGPLGQGISNAVGFAAARAHFAALYNKPGFELFDHDVYTICGDGCLQEGVSAEACSLAGHLGLGSLTVLYDDNDITIDGGTNLSFTEDVLKRFEAYGWHTSRVLDGDSDVADLNAKIAAAKAVTDKPSIIAVKTVIGKGSKKEGTHGVHGAPLGEEDIKFVKAGFGLDPEAKYAVGDDVRATYAAAAAKGDAACAAWKALFAKYKAAFPAEAAEIERRFMGGGLPAGWKDLLPTCTGADKPNATRKTSEEVLKALVPVMPEVRSSFLLFALYSFVCSYICCCLHYSFVAYSFVPSADGRQRRPDAVEQDVGGRDGRLPEGDARWALLPLRRARARHGRDVQRPLCVRRHHPVLCHLPQLHRVRLRRRSPLRAVAAPGDLRHDSRFHRARRGRPDAPADRGAPSLALHPGDAHLPPCGPERDVRGVRDRPHDPRPFDDLACTAKLEAARG
jgi:transketolase N-terminal domain/subunit